MGSIFYEKLPEYTIYPEDTMIKFGTLNVARNTARNTAKNTAKSSKNKIEENCYNVFNYLKEDPNAKQI